MSPMSALNVFQLFLMLSFAIASAGCGNKSVGQPKKKPSKKRKPVVEEPDDLSVSSSCSSDRTIEFVEGLTELSDSEVAEKFSKTIRWAAAKSPIALANRHLNIAYYQYDKESKRKILVIRKVTNSLVSLSKDDTKPNYVKLKHVLRHFLNEPNREILVDDKVYRSGKVLKGGSRGYLNVINAEGNHEDKIIKTLKKKGIYSKLKKGQSRNLKTKPMIKEVNEEYAYHRSLPPQYTVQAEVVYYDRRPFLIKTCVNGEDFKTIIEKNQVTIKLLLKIAQTLQGISKNKKSYKDLNVANIMEDVIKDVILVVDAKPPKDEENYEKALDGNITSFNEKLKFIGNFKTYRDFRRVVEPMFGVGKFMPKHVSEEAFYLLKKFKKALNTWKKEPHRSPEEIIALVQSY